MNVFITGGGGFIGHRLAQSLLARGTLSDANGTPQPIGTITLFDAAFPPQVDARLRCVSGDISQPGAVAAAMQPGTGAVFHLAAVVSGGAEADFDLGMRVNLHGTLAVLEACRAQPQPVRLVYASSGAVFGGDLPPVIDDAHTPLPQTSYGMQKIVGEYFVDDYSRKGFLDGRSLRLPTIMVRPGKPNLAASSFWSGIIREPLQGQAANCPVERSTVGWVLSPAKVVQAFIHACELPAQAWGAHRAVNLPGIAVSVQDILQALERIAGPQVTGRISFTPDERVRAIVKTWAIRYDTVRGRALGFEADAGVEDMIRDFIASEGITLPH